MQIDEFIIGRTEKGQIYTMKILDFKTVSPLFEMERDGIKPFTERLYDRNDKRFQTLANYSHRNYSGCAIRITNPNTGESFIREIISTLFLRYPLMPDPNDTQGRLIIPEWLIIFLGQKLVIETEVENESIQSNL